MSAHETRRLLVAASEADDRLEALYVLALYIGMRRGELLGLKWEDVDLDDSIVRVRRTLTRTDNGKRIALGEPKTKKSRRTVRLTPRAVEALRRHRARQAKEKLNAGGAYQDQGLVFAGEVGNLINPSNLRQRSFAPLLKRAGLPRITFHDLRAHICLASVPEERPPEVCPRTSRTRLRSHHPRHLQPHAPRNGRRGHRRDGRSARIALGGVNKGRILVRTFFFPYVFPGKTAFYEWAMLDSNQRPPPCKGELISSQKFVLVQISLQIAAFSLLKSHLRSSLFVLGWCTNWCIWCTNGDLRRAKATP
ncbi:MAG: site-specific integrase [Rubrobacter sp.]|nr:site-specific integrase [Rubrobacter sp.]